MHTIANHLYIASIASALVLGGMACGASSAQTCKSLGLFGTPAYRCVTEAPASEASDPEPAEPEEATEPEEPASKVVLKQDKIEILERVQFSTGSAEILTESYQLLDEVANTLTNNPDITAVRIEGHTDDTGSRSLNRKLSQDRADAVRTYLIDKGIDGERLTAKGFGPDKPIGDNQTEDGREQNRRVEFNITAHASD